MSQSVGLNFKSRIPSFSDDASIEEALKVYHYGVDNYTSQQIPDDSIEGNFRSLDSRVSANESAISGLGTTFIQRTSSVSLPNLIVPEDASTVPLTIRSVANQVSELLRIQNSSSTNIVSFFSNGGASFLNYISVGNITQSSTTAVNVTIGNSAHSGIVVRAASSQSGNMQEWQNSSASVIARVDSLGRMYSNSSMVVNLVDSQTMTNKTLTSPTLNTPSITGGSISSASSITLSGVQNNSSRVRNITFSTSDPSGGSDGDLWIKYIN